MLQTSDMRPPLMLVYALALATVCPLRAQPQLRVHPGDASISGRVIDQRTERPIEGALIRLDLLGGQSGLASQASLLTQTNGEGRYAFEHIAAGRYRVTASHAGYVTTLYGATPFTKSPVEGIVFVERRQSRSDVEIALTPGGVISGRVLRHDGQPLKDARVVAMLQFGDGGFTTLPNSEGRTNARGEYRFSDLPEGRYQIGAMWIEGVSSETGLPKVRSASTASPPRQIYYPGTSRVQDLVPVAVVAGATAKNVDIVFPGSEMLRVSGKIIRSGSGEPAEAFVMTGVAMQPLTVERDGSFTTPHLRAGRYAIVARATSDDALEAAMIAVDLSFDVSDVVIGLMPTGTIAGRVVTDDGSAVSDEMQVAAVLVDEGKELDEYRRDRAAIGPDGRFKVRGLFGERVMRMVGVTAGWKIKRVTIGKDEVATLSIEPGASIDNVLIVLTRS